MKKGLLTSIICFSSLVFSSCGSKYVKVTILECEHCHFENKTKARVAENFVIQAYVDKGYFLERSTDLLEIRVGKDNVKIYENGFDYDESSNQLTIHKEYTTFGDITIKGMAFPKTNTVTFVLGGDNTYKHISSSSVKECSVETDFIINLEINGTIVTPLTKDNIIVNNPEKVPFEYNESTNNLKISKEYCYNNMTISLP